MGDPSLRLCPFRWAVLHKAGHGSRELSGNPLRCGWGFTNNLGEPMVKKGGGWNGWIGHEKSFNNRVKNSSAKEGGAPC
jgi:hypothetical protein